MELDASRGGLSACLLRAEQPHEDTGNMAAWLEILRYIARHDLQAEKDIWAQIDAAHLNAEAVFVLSGRDWNIFPFLYKKTFLPSFATALFLLSPYKFFFPFVRDKRVFEFLNNLQRSVDLCFSKGLHMDDAPRIVADVKRGSLILKLDLTEIFTALAEKVTPQQAFLTALALISFSFGMGYMEHAEHVFAEQNRHAERVMEMEAELKKDRERLYQKRELWRITLDHLKASDITPEDLAAPWKHFLNSLDPEDRIRFGEGRELRREELLRAIDAYCQDGPPVPRESDRKSARPRF